MAFIRKGIKDSKKEKDHQFDEISYFSPRNARNGLNLALEKKRFKADRCKLVSTPYGKRLFGKSISFFTPLLFYRNFFRLIRVRCFLHFYNHEFLLISEGQKLFEF
jgi:hypothetical protein